MPVVPAQADEVAAEHRPNAKVSPVIWVWICGLRGENKHDVHKIREGGGECLSAHSLQVIGLLS